MSARSFITVASFETSFEAWLFRNRIAEHGISAIVTNEHIVNTYWLYSNAVGGVKVQIPSSELGAYEAMPVRPIEDMPPALTGDDSDTVLSTCPQCHSTEIYHQNWPRRLVFGGWLIFGFPPPIYYPTTICHSCGYRERPSLTIPRRFRIIHLLVLTTLVAVVLAFSTDLRVDLLDLMKSAWR